MFTIDKTSHIPVYEQLISRIERMIEHGVLRAGEELPSVRQLACELTVNPNTVQRAYRELEDAGITLSVHGVGRFVSDNAREILSERKSARRGKLYDSILRLRESGVEKDELISIINDIYGGNGNDQGR